MAMALSVARKNPAALASRRAYQDRLSALGEDSNEAAAADRTSLRVVEVVVRSAAADAGTAEVDVRLVVETDPEGYVSEDATSV